jgi:hypothetical protein
MLGWVVPVVFLFWLYRDGLKTWFVADDFAWLGLIRRVHNFRDLLNVLFTPAAQGTIRPWSERGFFLLFESVFGLDSLPFRICVFLTMAVNVTLVGWLTRRFTGSAVAGLAAAVLWTANTALVTVMAWSSAYNEALCTLFILTAMACFIRYTETGRRSFWWWQLVVFTLGFGALEANVIYPALAAAYALFVAKPERQTRKRLLISLIPLFCISVVYYLLHRAFVPLPSDGPYVPHIDGRIFQTLGVYWQWSLLPLTWKDVGHSARIGNVILGILTIAIGAFFIRQLTKSRYSVWFFVFWFLIGLAPMIALPEHRTDYYLTIPVIGLAMLAGLGVSQALEGAWIWRFAVLIPVVAYLSAMIPISRVASHWWVDRTRTVRGLVLGVAAAHERNPGKTIILDGISTDLFDDTLAESAFYPLGLNDVYLTPETGDKIHTQVDPDLLSKVVMDPAALRNAITHEQVVVYSDVGDHLRNVTEVWEQSISNRTPTDLDQVPRRVEVGNPLLAYLLGPEWFPVESSGFRWMPRRATVRLGGPRSPKDRLLLEGYCPDQQLKAGVLHLSVSVDGIPLESTQIGGPENGFRRLFNVPVSLVGRNTVEIAISVDRVLPGAGGRGFGLVFGTIGFEQ